MRGEFQSFDFPKQRVSNAEKQKPEWYANCCDWVIAQGLGFRSSTLTTTDNTIERKYNILHGNIPDEFYKKILNPYNATNKKYTHFPATMRNYDLMKGIIRRYVSEYIKNPHEFIVGANNPEVVLAKNAKLREEVMSIVQQQVAAKIQEVYKDYLQQGGDPQQFNPQEQFDINKFIEEFNENYIDDISEQGQQILQVIKDITEDTLLYAVAYFNYVSFGECYTYTDINGTDLVKRVISPLDAYPVPNDSMFVEDYDMFACRRRMTYQQIIDEFDEYLSAEDRKFLETTYARGNGSSIPSASYMFKDFESMFPNMCVKFSNIDRELFRDKNIRLGDINGNLYDVWHTVWRGEERQAIVSYVNENGLIAQRVENDGYKLNPSTGDISIDYVYVPQVYECTRIGTRETAIYPYGARAIAYNRNGKLPYNGLTELLPGFGKFSIIDIVTPYQVFYNIIAYHREMAIAKNKLNILLLAKSLLGKVPEDTIYKMIADGVLYIDDENDQGMLRAQQVRMVSADISNYITSLGQLLQETEQTAKNQVDMTPQRYGEIANSAGKGVTDEAIMRGSMGTVIIEYIMDCLRERDYARDMDYSKFAWIDGLDTSYRDEEGNMKYISLNVDKHVYADYLVKARNSTKEKEKLDQLKQFAFSMGQNGDAMMSIAAITGDNVASIKKLIKKFNDDKNAHEEQLKQMEQQTAQMMQEFEIQKIHAKGEEDRKTAELEGYIEEQIQLIKADANMISFDNGISEDTKEAGVDRLNAARVEVERERNRVAREKNMLDAFGKYQDRILKNKEIDTNLKIAKENKNRYDSKSKGSSK